MTEIKMQKIVPCLWFDTQAEEAAKFYINVFGNGKILTVSHYDKESAKVAHMPEGSVLVVEFELFGQKFTGLNGGPIFHFTEAISFIVNCDTQEEIDTYWEKLSANPESEQCGWLKDTFGVSWQIVPTILDKYLRDTDKTKASAVMGAMLSMKKIDIAKLKKAYNSSK